MSDQTGEKLNVDLTHPDVETKISALQDKITQKLTVGYGYELQDNTL